MNFKPDYGLHLLKQDWEKDSMHHFYSVPIDHIQFIDKDLFSFVVNLVFDGQEFAVSFDFDGNMLLEIFNIASAQVQNELREFLIKKPVLPCTLELKDSFIVDITAKLGELQKVEFEEFVPMIIKKVHKTNIEDLSE